MKLSDKVTIGKTGKAAPNRIALAPMTNCQSNKDGTISDDEYNWLVRRAEGGFGAIITCASHVSADGQGWDGELGIFDDKHLTGLKKLANGIHQYGSLGIVQIFHGGSRSPEKVTGKIPWSSSTFTIPGNPPKQVREATHDDIYKVIRDFANAANRAYKAGFDGVELHGAHGYLFHQFLSTDTNRRTDEWGGSFENRSRLLGTVLKEVKKIVPKSFIVGVRLSPEDRGGFKGIDFDEGLLTAKTLVAEGADYIHISAWEALKFPDKYKEKGKTIISYYREALPEDVTIMVAGEIWTYIEALACLENGANMVAIGRAGIGNPDWPKHLNDKSYSALKPPYTKEYLNSIAVGNTFVDYLRRWGNFIK